MASTSVARTKNKKSEDGWRGLAGDVVRRATLVFLPREERARHKHRPHLRRSGAHLLLCLVAHRSLHIQSYLSSTDSRTVIYGYPRLLFRCSRFVPSTSNDTEGQISDYEMIPEHELAREEVRIKKILQEIEQEESILQQRQRLRHKRKHDQVAQSRYDPGNGIAKAEQPTRLELIAYGLRPHAPG